MRRRVLVATSVVILTPLLLEVAGRIVLGEGFTAGVITDLPMNACVEIDGELGWRNRAGLEASCIGPSLEYPVFRYDVSINARGLRDDLHGYAPEEGVTRIVLLGDSFAWGWGVAQEECYAALLDRDLGFAFEVVNLGVPGYSTDQEVLLFEREGRKYEPSLVILGYVLNDAEGNLADSQYGLRKPRFVRPDGEDIWIAVKQPVLDHHGNRNPGWRTWLRANSAFVQVFQKPIVTREHAASAEVLDVPAEALEKHLRSMFYATYTDAEIRFLSEQVSDPTTPTHALLRRLKEACDDAGAELLVLTIPHHHDQYLYVPRFRTPDEALRALEGGTRYRTYLSRQVERAGEELGFATLSADHAMLVAVEAGSNLNVGDGHLTTEGHRLVADELRAWVEERYR